MRAMQKFFFLLPLIILTSLAHAEVEKVIITWNNRTCKEACAHSLEENLRKIEWVTDVITNPEAGRTDLLWKPNAPFSYPAIYAAMSMVGLAFIDIHVTISGTLTHTSDSVTLTSNGDNTRFILLNPQRFSTTQYIPQKSLATRYLSPELRNQLIDGENANRTAIISGQIFEPQRSPPLYLVVENLRFKEID